MTSIDDCRFTLIIPENMEHVIASTGVKIGRFDTSNLYTNRITEQAILRNNDRIVSSCTRNIQQIVTGTAIDR